MSMLNDISQAEQRITKSQREGALRKIKERKLDTRRKIEWGGLVVKSRMSQYSKEIILSVLIEAHKEIKQSPELRRLFQVKGEREFLVK